MCSKTFCQSVCLKALIEFWLWTVTVTATILLLSDTDPLIQSHERIGWYTVRPIINIFYGYYSDAFILCRGHLSFLSTFILFITFCLSDKSCLLRRSIGLASEARRTLWFHTHTHTITHYLYQCAAFMVLFKIIATTPTTKQPYASFCIGHVLSLKWAFVAFSSRKFKHFDKS